MIHGPHTSADGTTSAATPGRRHPAPALRPPAPDGPTAATTIGDTAGRRESGAPARSPAPAVADRHHRRARTCEAGMSSLADNPFEYRITKDGTVLISRGGRQIAIVGAARAAHLIARLESGDEEARQQALARITGNYRHGNERPMNVRHN
jgi:hypothetical protein